MRFAPSLLFVFLSSACSGTSTDVDSSGPWASLDERPCPSDSFLTWENFGDPFMRDWCTGCHSDRLEEGERAGAPLMVNLNRYEDVVLQRDRIWLRAADENQTMPPAGGPGEDERALLGEWLACGTPTR